MKSKLKQILPTLATTALLLTNNALADNYSVQSVPGYSCHGGNTFNGQQLTDYKHTESFLPPSAFQFWNNFYISEIGVKGDTEAQEITPQTPMNSPVVTIYSDSTKDFIMSLGIDLDPALTPSEEFNVPISRAYTITSSGPRTQLPTIAQDLHKFSPVQNRTEEITLADWNEAKGRMLLSCKGDDSGNVRLIADGLIPNGIYTVWQVFAVTNAPDGQQGPIPMTFSPMGGLDNTLVADNHGRAKFKRSLNYCPLERENPLMYVSLFLHWDHVLYGAAPVMIDQGMIPGRVGSNHLCFPTGDYL